VDDPEDWNDFTPAVDAGSSFLAELLREVARGHELYGADLEIVARRFSHDDILVRVAGVDGCAAVHLTWSHARELPPFPLTTWFDSVEEAKRALNEA
jgi:hypothetical protein